ncbi:hypothetical protein [Mesobacillus boroniphilus]|uniref:hypothetical protein n=1 Tax=Mesobacillus boroniphilus TaxID=308892 RepID=UPI0011DD5F63|nr:hypothetical protein [Mesobacillus boroniphilus]
MTIPMCVGMAKGKRYEKEFKIEINEHNKSVAQAAREVSAQRNTNFIQGEISLEEVAKQTKVHTAEGDKEKMDLPHSFRHPRHPGCPCLKLTATTAFASQDLNLIG